MEVIQRALLVRGPARRDRRRAPGGEPAGRAAARLRPPRRRRADLRPPPVRARPRRCTACSASRAAWSPSPCPALGFGLVLFAATSMYLDLNYRFYLVRRLFFRRASQNVVSPRREARRARAGHRHRPLRRRPHRRRVRAEARAPRPPRSPAALPWLGPFRLLFWSLALLLPALGARMAGLDSSAIAVAQLPFTLILLVAIFALVDIELSDVVPGANDNASGRGDRALARRRARRRAARAPRRLGRPPGAEECLQEGMRSFVRAHRDDLDRDSTYFLNLDTVGHGKVRFETAGGWVGHLRDGSPPGRARGGDRRGRRRRRAIATAPGRSPTPSPATRCRRDSPASRRSVRLYRRRRLRPHYHLPSDTPDTSTPTRSSAPTASRSS